MKMKQQAGFSMIEVLVASSILVVIVMMMGMLFQQGSAAWRVGASRADGFMKLRTVIGSLQRDASQAVDVNFIKQQRLFAHEPNQSAGRDPMSSKLNTRQQFSGNSLVFYTLNGVTNRAIGRVTYSFGNTVTRLEEHLKPNNQWDSGRRQTLVSSRSNTGSTPTSWQIQAYRYSGDSAQTASSGEFPAYITVSTEVTSTDDALDIGAASAGPDRAWGTPDDITTWNTSESD